MLASCGVTKRPFYATLGASICRWGLHVGITTCSGGCFAETASFTGKSNTMMRNQGMIRRYLYIVDMVLVPRTQVEG